MKHSWMAWLCKTCRFRWFIKKYVLHRGINLKAGGFWFAGGNYNNNGNNNPLANLNHNTNVDNDNNNSVGLLVL